MLINVSQPEECRIAIVEDGVLEELYVERTGQDNYVGNIYKGVVVNLEPSIQAAFVDFGVGRNGFLHISDVEPQYFRQGGYDPDRPIEPGGPRRARRAPAATPTRSTKPTTSRRTSRNRAAGGRPSRQPPPRQTADPGHPPPRRRGAGAGDQGRHRHQGPHAVDLHQHSRPLPGADAGPGPGGRVAEDRGRRGPPPLRDIMLELNPPKGLGFIVRTAGADRTKQRALPRPGLPAAALEGDRAADQEDPAPGGHLRRKRHDHPHHPRHLHREVDTIYIDEPNRPASGPRNSCSWSCPATSAACSSTRARSRCSTSYGLDEEIAKIHRRKVPLKQGGSIVIDQTEALVAIDVNSGSFRADDSAEETAYQMNLLAAREIARQIRLRDLGGVVVNDFIDMRKERHRRGVERALARRGQTRPCPHQDPPHQPLRPDRDDPAADPPQPQAERLPRLPGLQWDGRGQDGRKHGHRGGPAVDPGQPAADLPRSPSPWPTTWPTT